MALIFVSNIPSDVTDGSNCCNRSAKDVYPVNPTEMPEDLQGAREGEREHCNDADRDKVKHSPPPSKKAN